MVALIRRTKKERILYYAKQISDLLPKLNSPLPTESEWAMHKLSALSLALHDEMKS